jgi:hypothetical protein
MYEAAFVPIIQQQFNDDLIEAEEFTELMDMENISMCQHDNGEGRNNPLNHPVLTSSEIDFGV